MSSISEAFKRLDVHDGYDKVYRVLHEYLLTIKQYNDLKAFKACLVALIHLDRYHQAYKLIRQHMPPQFADDLVLEIAYVYYKLDRHADLAQLAPPDDPVAVRGLEHIIAQNAYRSGDYAYAARIYASIAADSRQYDSPVDLKVNQLAVASQMLLTGTPPTLTPFVTDANPDAANADNALTDNYDYLFNCALVDLGRRRRRAALATLERAAALCRAAGDDDVTPIVLAIGFIHQQLGDTDRAQLAYLEAPAADDYYRFLVKNNLALVAPQSNYDNPNLVARDLDLMGNHQRLQPKLTHLQRQTVVQLERVLGYVTGTASAAIGDGGRHVSGAPLSDATLDMLALLSHANLSMAQLTLAPRALGRRLLPYTTDTHSPRQRTVALLLLAYLGAQQNNYDQVLPALEREVQQQIADNLLVPALLGILLAIYDEQHLANLYRKRWDVVRHVLTRFVEGQLDQFPVNAVQLVALQALTESKDAVIQEAGRAAFAKLAEAYPDDTVVQAVVALSTEGLASVELLTEGIASVADLLAAPLDQVLPEPKKLAAKTTASTTTSGKVTKPKKKTPKFGAKKVMQTGDYVDADPERWMPMKMRLYYKPTKKDKKKMGGHQGALEKKKKK